MLYCTHKEPETSSRQNVGQPMANNSSQLTINLLGTPEVHSAGTPLALHNHKARALLYYLAATGRPHTRDHLATLLWSESPESNARHSLRSSLYHSRQALLYRDVNCGSAPAHKPWPIGSSTRSDRSWPILASGK